MSDLHFSRQIKAVRVKQRCEQCGTTILPGEPAHYAFGKYANETYSYYCHQECRLAGRAFAELNGLWGEDYPWFQHMEDGEFAHHAWLLENHPIVAERMGIAEVPA